MLFFDYRGYTLLSYVHICVRLPIGFICITVVPCLEFRCSMYFYVLLEFIGELMRQLQYPRFPKTSAVIIILLVCSGVWFKFPSLYLALGLVQIPPECPRKTSPIVHTQHSFFVR